VYSSELEVPGSIQPAHASKRIGRPASHGLPGLGGDKSILRGPRRLPGSL
jgi:hypothetical protein